MEREREKGKRLQEWMEGEVESEVDGYTGQKKTSLHKNVDFLSGDRG